MPTASPFDAALNRVSCPLDPHLHPPPYTVLNFTTPTQMDYAQPRAAIWGKGVALPRIRSTWPPRLCPRRFPPNPIFPTTPHSPQPTTEALKYTKHCNLLLSPACCCSTAAFSIALVLAADWCCLCVQELPQSVEEGGVGGSEGGEGLAEGGGWA